MVDKKLAMIYQETTDNSNQTTDQNTRIQMQQQQQQIADSAYFMLMSNAQVDVPHPQMHHQQPQLIHTAVPPPPVWAVPMPSYYQMYPVPVSEPTPSHYPPLNQQNFVYYMPTRQGPHGYNLQLQQQAAGYAEVSSAAVTSLSHNQAPPPAYTTNRPAHTLLLKLSCLPEFMERRILVLLNLFKLLLTNLNHNHRHNYSMLGFHRFTTRLSPLLILALVLELIRDTNSLILHKDNIYTMQQLSHCHLNRLLNFKQRLLTRVLIFQVIIVQNSNNRGELNSLDR